MIYRLIKKRTEILLLAISHIAHLCNQFNCLFALLIPMPRFKSINFYQNRPEIKLFLQKKKLQKFRAFGACPQTSIAYFWDAPGC